MKRNRFFIILLVTLLSIPKINSVLIAVRTPCTQGSLFLTSVQNVCLHCACIMPNISACKPNLLKLIHACSGQVGTVTVTTRSPGASTTSSATTTSTISTSTRSSSTTSSSSSTTTPSTTTTASTSTSTQNTNINTRAPSLPTLPSFVNTRTLVIYFPPV